MICTSDLPKYQSTISEPVFEGFIPELHAKLAAFKTSANESFVRVFVSPFMTRAVQFMQHKFPALVLKAEAKLKVTRGYGPIDYSVKMLDIVILVTEAKYEDFT